MRFTPKTLKSYVLFATLIAIGTPALAVADSGNLKPLVTIQQGQLAGFHYSVTNDPNKITGVTSGINDQNVAETCELNINAEMNREISNKISGLTEAEKQEYMFMHEQAHCADYAHLFKNISHYQTLVETTETSSTLGTSVLNESFADAFALLMMAAKKPERGEQYLKSIEQFRLKEWAEAQKNVGYNDHATIPALRSAYQALVKLGDISQLDDYQLEQGLAIIAAAAAEYSYQDWQASQRKSMDQKGALSADLEKATAAARDYLNAPSVLANWRLQKKDNFRPTFKG